MLLTIVMLVGQERGSSICCWGWRSGSRYRCTALDASRLLLRSLRQPLVLYRPAYPDEPHVGISFWFEQKSSWWQREQLVSQRRKGSGLNAREMPCLSWWGKEQTRIKRFCRVCMFQYLWRYLQLSQLASQPAGPASQPHLCITGKVSRSVILFLLSFSLSLSLSHSLPACVSCLCWFESARCCRSSYKQLRSRRQDADMI